jgi:hypothetical protein
MENEIQNIQHLLSHISAISQKYDQIAEITGENFNVFKVLGLTSNEVRTHSAFIAELLNPKGSHGCKDIFLKLFVEKLRSIYPSEQTMEIIGGKVDFLERLNLFTSSDKCSAFVEYYIGEINEEITKGGRIDILLRDQNNHQIIIENKIYAGEQPNQLIRYKKYNSQVPIIYLTLYGEKPTRIKSEKQELKELEDFICISYKDDILNWLEQCLKETVNKPILRETITQYINLINHLTNQTINNKMKDEMIDKILKNHENIDAAIEIVNNISEVKFAILKKYMELVVEKLEKDGWIVEYNKLRFGAKDSNVTFYKSGWCNLFYLYFLRETSCLSIGIYSKDKNKIDKNLQMEARRILATLNIGEQLNYGDWIWLSRFGAWHSTSWSEVSEQAFINKTIDTIKQIEESLKEFKL